MENEGNTLGVPAMLMAVGGLVFLAHLFQFVFQRFRVPDTLWLIGIGLVENLIYAIIFYSIATTALLVFLFERTQAHRVFSGWWFRPN